jgi:hypothetical protein
MRRLHFGLLGASLPLLALGLTLTGCTPATSPSSSSGDKPSDSSAAFKADWKGIEPGDGVITGKVTLKGAGPDLKKLDADLMVKIQENKNKEMCLKGTPEELQQQGYRIKDGKVANVFVWIQPAERNTYFKIDDPAKWMKPVEIVQPHCAFIPHVAVLFPEYRDPKDPSKTKKTGQKVTAKNTATESHNTKYGDPNSRIKGDNKVLQPGESMELVIDKLSPEPVVIGCNIHPWMDAYLRTFDHPFAVLTDNDGTFLIEKVPTDVKLKIFAWHEKAGDLTEKGEDITVEKGKPVTKDFSLEMK